MTSPQEQGPKGEIPSYLRLALAKEDGLDKKSKVREYSPSTTEKLLENICRSFGTELGQAYVNPSVGAKLVRESKPVIVTHPQTGEGSLLQFQYTRFSPFSRRIVEIYNKNRDLERKRKRKLDFEEVYQEIKARVKERDNGKWSAFLEVTDAHYLPDANLHRFEKELYFAVYALDDKAISPEELEPFLIHEAPPFKGILPTVFIIFHIQPHFVIDIRTEPTTDIYDTLTFSFPQISKRHRRLLDEALSLHPLDKLDPKKIRSGWSNPEILFEATKTPGTFYEEYRISSHLPRELTMAAIQVYLKATVSS